MQQYKMRGFIISLILLLALQLFCVSPIKRKSATMAAQYDNLSLATEQYKLTIPHATWEPLFFKSINKRVALAGLTDLRSVRLTGDDLEIRVWAGFGLTQLKGYRLTRMQGVWQAFYVPPISENVIFYPNQIVMPKSGWDVLWQRLQKENILTLPDASELKGEILIEDGISYVVEINYNSEYRTYMYSNPSDQTWIEAQNILNIIKILEDEFQIPKHV